MNNGIMAEFLKKHQAEVMDVCITEFNEKVFVDGIRAEGRMEVIESMLRMGRTPEEIVSFTGIPMEEVRQVEESMLAQV